MFLIPVYLRLCRLHAANQHLLKMYYFLYDSLSGEEGPYYKQEFSRRISQREKINREIEECLRENSPVAGGSRLYKLMRYFSPAVFALDYYFHSIFYPVNIDRCQYFEIKNIEMYYVFLYAGTGNEEIINMLLDQKSVIENSVFSEL